MSFAGSLQIHEALYTLPGHFLVYFLALLLYYLLTGTVVVLNDIHNLLFLQFKVPRFISVYNEHDFQKLQACVLKPFQNNAKT